MVKCGVRPANNSLRSSEEEDAASQELGSFLCCLVPFTCPHKDQQNDVLIYHLPQPSECSSNSAEGRKGKLGGGGGARRNKHSNDVWTRYQEHKFHLHRDGYTRGHGLRFQKKPEEHPWIHCPTGSICKRNLTLA